MFKSFTLLWLYALLSSVTAKGKRGRYLPIEEPNNNNAYTRNNRALQSNNNRVLGIAYECNDNDFPLDLPKVRRYVPGDIIKICIKPEIRSERRGVVMRTVDTMNFMGEGSGISQRVIEYKQEYFTTLALCVPGQLVCSFKTKLREELFWGLEGDEVNITGVALVTMEYIDKSFALNGLADFDIPVGLTFLVKRVAPPPGTVLGVPGGEVTKQCNPHWWCQYPDWFKILMIILILLFLCCCCIMCFTIPCMIREMAEDDREREERRQFIREQKMREENGEFYPEGDQYYEDQYPEQQYQPQYQQQTYRDRPEEDPYDDQQQHRSYRGEPEPAYEEPPRQQSSYRVPRAENSSFQKQGSQRYEY